MHWLILGGTRFVGRHLVEAALSAGHQVTLFHRGQSGTELFEGRVQRVLGDRREGLAGLGDRTFDAVVDTCGYLPKDVQRACRDLQGRVGLYLFVSSISVIAADAPPPLTEESPLTPIGDPNATEVTGETYGYLKVLCEEAVREAFPDRAAIVRPGLIVGPHDPTDRFTYWVVRMARGGSILAPLEMDKALQVIDVRDLAQFVLRQLEGVVAETVQVVGPEDPLTFGAYLDACQLHAPAGTRVYGVSSEFMEQNQIQPWVDLPLYAPADGLMRCGLQRARGLGLHWRPLAETIGDTLAWFREERGMDSGLKTGLTPEREERLLQLWWS